MWVGGVGVGVGVGVWVCVGVSVKGMSQWGGVQDTIPRWKSRNN